MTRDNFTYRFIFKSGEEKKSWMADITNTIEEVLEREAAVIKAQMEKKAKILTRTNSRFQRSNSL